MISTLRPWRKIERDHAPDRIDVAAMFDRRLVDRERLRELFESIADQLFRDPAVDASAFRRAVEARLLAGE